MNDTKNVNNVKNVMTRTQFKLKWFILLRYLVKEHSRVSSDLGVGVHKYFVGPFVSPTVSHGTFDHV